MDVCASPEFAIHSVPVLLAYSKGSQKGRVVKRTDNNRLILDYAANILGVKLHDRHGGGNHQYLPNQLGEQSKPQIENEVVTQGLRGRSEGGKNFGGIVAEKDESMATGSFGGGDGESYSGMYEMTEEEVAKEMMRRDAAKKNEYGSLCGTCWEPRPNCHETESQFLDTNTNISGCSHFLPCYPRTKHLSASRIRWG